MGKLVLVGFIALLCAGLVLMTPIVALVNTMLEGLARAGI
jgi:hypothetical protein